MRIWCQASVDRKITNINRKHATRKEICPSCSSDFTDAFWPDFESSVLQGWAGWGGGVLREERSRTVWEQSPEESWQVGCPEDAVQAEEGVGRGSLPCTPGLICVSCLMVWNAFSGASFMGAWLWSPAPQLWPWTSDEHTVSCWHRE